MDQELQVLETWPQVRLADSPSQTAAPEARCPWTRSPQVVNQEAEAPNCPHLWKVVCFCLNPKNTFNDETKPVEQESAEHMPVSPTICL